ncbi:hypothetical protein EG830_15450 [bacterium]|nr:hypothetical protein [bacterium]
MSTDDTGGLAKGYNLRFFFPDHQPYIDIEWTVREKVAEIIPEGGWLCVPMAVNNPYYEVSHVSAPFNPEKDLVPGTNAHLFSTDYGISARDSVNGAGVAIVSTDLPLWSLGEPGLWKYSKVYKPGRHEIFANLYNNQWNTNFPLWIDGSWKASFRFWPVVKGTGVEEALFTPGWEQRQKMLSAFAEGPKGSLPVSSGGIAFSRKGIRLTSLSRNPDHEEGVDGTLMRLWEQSGISGDVTVSFPEGSGWTKAQPVSLRGEKTGKAVSIRDRKLTIRLGAYSPASYVLY